MRKILTAYNNNNDNHRSELLHSLIYAVYRVLMTACVSVFLFVFLCTQ